MARKLITADETTNELPASAKFSSGSELEAQVNAKVAGKQDAGDYVLTSDARLTDTRTPKTHSHAIADVTNLQTTLDGKQASGSYATSSALTTGLAGKANTTHNQAATTVSVVENGTLTGITAQLALESLAARIAALEVP